MHPVTALLGPQPCLKSELCWARAGPDLWQSGCHVLQGSARWQVVLADLGAAAQPGCSPLPVCRTLGGCEGLPEFEDRFLRVIKSSCNVNL